MWQKIFISTRNKKRNLVGLDNQDGQIAIFIALIFQVLFIFFAMLINVGLIVHDKINLQNSVDFAAYYGAERQAELLNEIAHINYQIRQENKLLAFRQRILGPYTFPGNSATAVPPADVSVAVPAASVCVDHAGWKEIKNVDFNHPVNYCDALFSYKPPVPTFNSIASFIGINTYLVGYFQKVADAVKKGCDDFGPLNWYTASLWLYEYKTAVRNRSEMIRTLAGQLSQPGKTFTDFKGGLVITGVRKTFLRNLTEANRVSISTKASDQIDNAADFTFINSLSSDAGGCGTLDAAGNPAWLHENRISPQIVFSNSTVGGGASCSSFRDVVSNIPTGPGMTKYSILGATLAAIIAIDKGEPGPDTRTIPYSSTGFEKNPWCLAYVGVKATTRPRKPFAPFGKPVSLQARAFASPFGGRIGPWTHSQWPSGVSSSSGGTLVDPLLVPREAGTAVTAANIDQIVPNYSRYPGDVSGLNSQLEHFIYARSLLGPVGATGGSLVLTSYDHFTDPTNKDSLSMDPLYVPSSNVDIQPLRGLETQAIAPDLFDITYYSIDADYGNFYQALSPNGFVPMGDLGSNLDDPKLAGRNVKLQMIKAKSSLIDMHIPGVNWLVPSLDYLLTGWTQGKTGDYSPNPKLFATCSIHPNYADGWPANPGYCVVGGRTGYSVRIIGRKYLNSSNLELGGDGVKGKILNAPPW